MPPKPAKQDRAQQKAEEKRKAKIAEDKTFGLKNKNKSKTVQKYIKSVQQQVVHGKVKSEQQLAQEEHEKKEQKKQQRQAALLASLAKGTQDMKKVAVSQNAAQVKEGQMIDVYVDQREQRKQETMADWDQSKLEQVVKSKHGNQRPVTDIVCKFFLDAVEKRLYGWFWQCPNGEQCQYRHCLPPGYVLKKKEVDPAELEEDEEPIEEIIERERAALPLGSGTPVTFETFMAWKKKKKEEAIRAEAEKKEKEAKDKGGRQDMSGRDLFSFDPSLFVDDAAAADSAEYLEDEEYEQERIQREEDEAEAAREEVRAERERIALQEEEQATSSSPVSDKTTDKATDHSEQPTVKNAALFLQTEDDVDLDALED
eukprot:Blabericola_migrator_1__1810@NODE_1490_length_4432_cov_90_837801_g569_i3_p2_GENE_NODE_1490_length_4432_cov_90_837801_g569_i3NODE_1490_length_4432_cov_90_837801_g569_i3_p2_ORF_typecomplete_len370_score125_48DFRP_C/PF16543_5/1_8e04DFRP_C/PF16543_5/1_8e04DFRP_C/PF16543_5/8_9e23DFRP_C/PF16543_5/4_3e03zfCCCH_2/PF14608_6/0_0002zf_CCCH_4/PF18345_1/2_4e02zf_CCCH_4/PF18345_1/0_21zfCCCH_4/PF18044_1/0_29zfCCCH/PF00642_24/1_4zfCCCH_3/PF15663_5/2_6e03zfCCCH_3/PF15663_5/1_4e03zfCCCH_3/PF15663_5/0_37_NODE_1490